LIKEKSEYNLYPVVAEFLRRKGFAVRIDYPKGTGIKFNLLKGWTVDVVGIKTEDGRKEVVAVEVKNRVSPANVMQALSQAEIYQKACTKVYIAFPASEWDKEENTEAVKEVMELCQARGIGILKVRSLGLRQPCIEILSPITSLRLDIYKGIIEQFDKKINKFNGFNIEDFQRTLEDDSKYHRIVRKKLKFLVDDLFEMLPSRLRRRLKYYDIGRSGFWAYLSEEPNKVQCAHFNLTISGEDLRIGVITEGKKPVAKLLKNIENRKREFLKILKSVRGSTLGIWKRIPTGVPREFEFEDICTFESQYMDELAVDFILKKSKLLELVAIRLYFSYYYNEEIVHSNKLTEELINDIELLEPFYHFARG